MSGITLVIDDCESVAIEITPHHEVLAVIVDASGEQHEITLCPTAAGNVHLTVEGEEVTR